MPSINKHALVPYSAKQMYDLVNDVESYDQFLPGCKRSNVLEHSDTHMKARMTLSKAGIEKELTTLNTLIENKEIKMQLADGPFKALSGGWKFIELSEDACKVELNLDFTFTNRFVEMAFGRVFTALTQSMVKAFSDRAKQVYR